MVSNDAAVNCSDGSSCRWLHVEIAGTLVLCSENRRLSEQKKLFVALYTGLSPSAGLKCSGRRQTAATLQKVISMYGSFEVTLELVFCRYSCSLGNPFRRKFLQRASSSKMSSNLFQNMHVNSV